MPEEVIELKLPKKKKNIWLIVLFIGVALLVGGLGYFAGRVDFASLFNRTQTVDTPVVMPESTIVKPQQYALVVKDSISGDALDKVMIKTSDASYETDTEGKVSIEAFANEKITISLKGYHSKTMEVKDEKDISLTPEGRVVFVSNRDGKRNIYTINYDGSEEKKLLARSGETEHYSPVISPRERYVAFLSTDKERKSRYGSPAPTLELIKIDGSARITISEFYNIRQITWSPDGTYIGWIGDEKDEDGTLNKAAIRDITTGKTTYFGEQGDYINNISFSKDDAMVSFGVGGSSKDRTGIWVADGDGNNPKRVATSGSSPQFNDDNNVEYMDYVSGKNKKMVWTSKTNAVKEISEDTTKRTGIQSPDKKLVAFIDYRDGKRNLYVSKPNKQDEVKLTTVDAAGFPVRWTLDGKYITFNINKTGESARYIVAASGKGTATKIVDELSEGYEGMY